MHPLLISKRESCLKFGYLAVLAANATRRGNEICFSDELRGMIGNTPKSLHDKNPVARCLLWILIYY